MRIKIKDGKKFYAYVTLWYIVLIVMAEALYNIGAFFYAVGDFFDNGSYKIGKHTPIVDWITVKPEDEQ